MPHFFISSENKQGNKIIISDKKNYNHIARSLRAKSGENLLLIDENQIQYETKITNIDKQKIEVEIEKSYKSERDLKFDLFLAQSPLRSDAQNFVIEKATELGARGVFPVTTDNCALNSSVIDKKIEKWQKIMYEASKQCERADIPVCEELTTFDKLPLKEFDRVIVYAERLEEMSLKEYIAQSPIKENAKILVIIGPEGGFSDREFEWFKSQKLPLVTLGKLILKAETAAIVGLGNLIYGYSK